LPHFVKWQKVWTEGAPENEVIYEKTVDWSVVLILVFSLSGNGATRVAGRPDVFVGINRIAVCTLAIGATIGHGNLNFLQNWLLKPNIQKEA
jgi:hypothetical protein